MLHWELFTLISYYIGMMLFWIENYFCCGLKTLLTSRHHSCQVFFSIQCHRVDEYQFLQVGRHWGVYLLDSIKEHRLEVHPFFTSTAQYIMLILLGQFVRWEVSGYIIAVFGVLLPGFVQNSVQHSCVVPI